MFFQLSSFELGLIIFGTDANAIGTTFLRARSPTESAPRLYVAPLTFDLDRPTRGVVTVPDTPLVELRASMELPPAAQAPSDR